MASKETADLIIEAIDYYITNGLMPDGSTADIDAMRKIVKYDDLKKSLNKKDD